MTMWTGPLLPLATLVWPLLLAVLTSLPVLRPHGVRFLPLAPLPALWLAVMHSGDVTAAPDLLLGVRLGLDGASRPFLGMTAALWCLAGIAAQPMAGRPNSALFSGFWSLTLAGNLGVFLALDVVTFYVAFAAVSLASWFLIVHDQSAKALRAGRVYIAIALVGEVAILVGITLGTFAAGSITIVDVRNALGPTGVVLLVVGLGVKAGLVPLHVWLPLAHPAAPVPASAVLSGAMVKAGLFGLILFVPEEMFVSVLMGLGVVGAFGAALWGMTQSDPKAVLAYSTISQMGLMILLVGAGGAAREIVPYFALHHGFAKGALFLLVGVMLVARDRWQRLLCLFAGVVVAGSVAGFPLTGGALAKAAVKEGLSQTTSMVLSLSSFATSLILIWFLNRLWHLKASDAAEGWSWRLLPPVLAGIFAFAVPWFLWQSWTEKELGYLLENAPLTDALWPIAVAFPPALALLRWRVPSRPPGDLLLPVERRWAGSVRIPGMASLQSPRADLIGTLPSAVAKVERILSQWRSAGALVPLLVLLMFALLA